MYLDRVLHRPWRKRHPGTALVGYVDDIAVVCQPGDDPESLYDDLANLLVAAGLPLKGNRAEATHDLGAGDVARWLGLDLWLHGGGDLAMRLPVDDGELVWMERLQDSLALAHEKSHAPLRALQSLDGLLQSAAPCFPYTNRTAFYQKTVATMSNFGFEEMLSRKQFVRRWRGMNHRWVKVREATAAALANAPDGCQSPVVLGATEQCEDSGAINDCPFDLSPLNPVR